jgi:metallo-beta-lactamase class B
MKKPRSRALILACALSLPAGGSFGQATPETAKIPQPHLARALADAAAEGGWKHPALITCYPNEGQSAEHVIKDPGPAKAADNLYFLGNGIVAAWAVDTSDGIILIDTLYNYAVEPEIVDGLKKLGLNPASIKYVIITHAHGDHDEGAKLLQDRYGTHVVMGAPDWELIAKNPNMPGGVPKPDIVAQDGQKLTLGDTTVTILTTPGHTLGTLSMIFTVKDHGKPVTIAYSGGTAFNFPKDVARYETYIASQKKMADAAKAAGATVIMSNHSEFDDAWDRGRLVRLRRAGEPHPYEVGADAVQRYFTMTAECAMAMRDKLASK